MSTPLDYDSYRNRQYFPELDGLRAISVLLVVAFHMQGFRQLIWDRISGYGGVMVFFVLSGFLITTLGLREESAHGRLALGAFYIRRCFRIFPLFYVVLALYGVLIVGFSFPADTTYLPDFWEHLPWLAGYLQEVAVFCRPFGGPCPPFCQAWSLAVEEKFYLAWPLLLFVMCRHLSPNARLAFTAVLGIGIYQLSRTLGYYYRGADECVIGHGYILIGCLLAQALHDRRWFERLKALVGPKSLLVFAALLVATLLALPPAVTLLHYRACDALSVVFCVLVGLVLVGLLLRDGPLQRALRWGPLVWVGKLSYGIYLIHLIVRNCVLELMPAARENLVVNLLAFVLTCVGSVAVAWVLAVVVERPAIEAGRRLSRAARGSPRVSAPAVA